MDVGKPAPTLECFYTFSFGGGVSLGIVCGVVGLLAARSAGRWALSWWRGRRAAEEADGVEAARPATDSAAPGCAPAPPPGFFSILNAPFPSDPVAEDAKSGSEGGLDDVSLGSGVARARVEGDESVELFLPTLPASLEPPPDPLKTAARLWAQ